MFEVDCGHGLRRQFTSLGCKLALSVIRDDVRAQLRLTVKKILLRYGYPPDVTKMEADRVIAQSESLADASSRE